MPSSMHSVLSFPHTLRIIIVTVFQTLIPPLFFPFRYSDVRTEQRKEMGIEDSPPERTVDKVRYS